MLQNTPSPPNLSCAASRCLPPSACSQSSPECTFRLVRPRNLALGVSPSICANMAPASIREVTSCASVAVILPLAPPNSQEVRVATWNIAAINNNPFEYWVVSATYSSSCVRAQATQRARAAHAPHARTRTLRPLSLTFRSHTRCLNAFEHVADTSRPGLQQFDGGCAGLHRQSGMEVRAGSGPEFVCISLC